jgi:hypothetical protein
MSQARPKGWRTMSIFHEEKTVNLLGSFSLAAVIWFYFSYGDYNGYFCPSSCLMIFFQELLFLTVVTAFLFISRHYFLFSSRRSLRIFAYCIFLGAFLLILREIEMSKAPNPSTRAYKIGWLLGSVSVLSGVMVFYWKKPKGCARGVTLLLAFLTPFGLWNIALSCKNLCFVSPIHPYPLHPQIKEPKIIWMLFDEMDPFFAITHRPSSIALPELDLLRNQSVNASHMYQLGNGTLGAIPSLTLGEKCDHVMRQGPNCLQVFPKKGASFNWKNGKHIFIEAYQMNRNPAVLGWYHPYDFLLKGVTYFSRYEKNNKVPCLFWVSFGTFLQTSFLNPLAEIFSKFFKPNNKSDFLLAPKQEEHYFAFLEDVKSVLSDDKYNFVFIHFPIPHAPTITKFSHLHENPLVDNYLNNLLLVDKTLCVLRKSLGDAKWNSAVVVLTSDHWFRPPSLVRDFPEREKYLVPFLIKMPFQKEGYVCDTTLNSTILFPFFLEVMRGNLRTEKDLLSFIERKKAFHCEPFIGTYAK